MRHLKGLSCPVGTWTQTGSHPGTHTWQGPAAAKDQMVQAQTRGRARRVAGRLERWGEQVQPNFPTSREGWGSENGKAESRRKAGPAVGEPTGSEHGRATGPAGLQGAGGDTRGRQPRRGKGVAGVLMPHCHCVPFLLGHSEPSVARLPGSWTQWPGDQVLAHEA